MAERLQHTACMHASTHTLLVRLLHASAQMHTRNMRLQHTRNMASISTYVTLCHDELAARIIR